MLFAPSRSCQLRSAGILGIGLAVWVIAAGCGSRKKKEAKTALVRNSTGEGYLLGSGPLIFDDFVRLAGFGPMEVSPAREKSLTNVCVLSKFS